MPSNCGSRMRHIRGRPKIPGIVKKNYLKYLYNFETSVPFKVLPLRLDAEIPAQRPMLETLSKIFNGNAVKGRQLICISCCLYVKLLLICLNCCLYVFCYYYILSYSLGSFFINIWLYSCLIL